MDEAVGSEPRRLLLAGSLGPERVPAQPDPDESRWYEPLHVRDEPAVRERIAAQVGVGADVVLAPAWLTHRRALLPLGETRRARDWTAAAVRVARDAVEVGLERREELAASAEDGGAAQATPVTRPMPLVAAPLPAFDKQRDPASGRLLPRDAATSRDYHDQAGLIADAEPDLILVEETGSQAAARTAVEQAASTGLPTWAVAAASSDQVLDDDSELARWLETCRVAGAEAVLLDTPSDRATELMTQSSLRWGGLVTEAEAAAADESGSTTYRWLDRGANIVGLLDRASPEVIARVRSAIDEHERVEVAAQAASLARWSLHVSRAAQVAPGGAALWLGDSPAAPLPGGFEWLVIAASEIQQLPHGQFRLIVAADSGGQSGETLALLLRDGGVMALRQGSILLDVAGLRLLWLDADRDPPTALYRRED